MSLSKPILSCRPALTRDQLQEFIDEKFHPLVISALRDGRKVPEDLLLPYDKRFLAKWDSLEEYARIERQQIAEYDLKKKQGELAGALRKHHDKPDRNTWKQLQKRGKYWARAKVNAGGQVIYYNKDCTWGGSLSNMSHYGFSGKTRGGAPIEFPSVEHGYVFRRYEAALDWEGLTPYQRSQVVFHMARINLYAPVHVKLRSREVLPKAFLDQWKESGQAKDVLRQVMRAKFCNNAEALRFLLATGDAYLGEATGDKYWAIGIHFRPDWKQPESILECIADPLRHRGLNIQGHILMDIREEARKEWCKKPTVHGVFPLDPWMHGGIQCPMPKRYVDMALQGEKLVQPSTVPSRKRKSNEAAGGPRGSQVQRHKEVAARLQASKRAHAPEVVDLISPSRQPPKSKAPLLRTGPKSTLPSAPDLKSQTLFPSLTPRDGPTHLYPRQAPSTSSGSGAWQPGAVLHLQPPVVSWRSVPVVPVGHPVVYARLL